MDSNGFKGWGWAQHRDRWHGLSGLQRIDSTLQETPRRVETGKAADASALGTRRQLGRLPPAG